jgi:signal transduction histidine kinase/ligand-binding sensor domain-containing protein/DNA-binding response OmpR family regulator
MKGPIIFYIWLITGLLLNAGPEKFYFDYIDTKDGLSDNQVQCILKDSRGFMWFGTSMGLNRYDGYSFKVLKRRSTDSISLADDRVVSIIEDHAGYLWIVNPIGYSIYDPRYEVFVKDNELFHKNIPLPNRFDQIIKDNTGDFWFINNNEGLFWYSLKTDSIIKFTANPSDTNKISAQNVNSIAKDSEGRIWLINNYGIIELLNLVSGKVIYRNQTLNKIYNNLWMNLRLFIDSDGDIWIYSISDAEGVYLLENKTKKIQHFYQGSVTYKLNNNIVKDIVQDKYGLIWVGTDHGGINIINKKDFSTRYIQNNPDDKRSLSLNSVTALYRDNNDIIWVGTFKKGVCYYHENLYKFSLYRHQPGNPSSLVFDDLNCFAEDEKGIIWIGTNGEGLTYFNPTTEQFHQIVHDPSNPNSLSNNVIVSMLYDSQKKLWLGTFYGGLDLYDGKTFRHFRHNPSNSNSIADDRIWEIFEDSEHNIWVGTLGAGLDLFDKQKNTFRHYRSEDLNSIHSNYIFSIKEDNAGNLWIGTANGIDVYIKKTRIFTHYQNDPINKTSLSSNIVLAVIKDNRGMIWAGSREGLNLFDPKTKSFRIFNTEDGLLDNSIVSMVEDRLGNIWIGTSMGLSCLKIKETSNSNFQFNFINYTESDGLQGKAFNQNAAFLTSRGELLFAGPNGFNRFYPEKLTFNKYIPKVYITGFQIMNNPVELNKKTNGRIIIQQNISDCNSIKLKHFEDVITIEFAALNYIHPQENKYKYKLEGFNREWMITDGKDRKATYTNLDPGDYVFKVIASNNDGVWNESGASLKIEVLPPFWKSRFAFVVYLLFLIGSLLLARKIILMRERMKFSYKQEKLESQRRHEIDLMKIRFFTNVSHEFRTPLTLIISPLEKIIKESKDIQQKPHLELIYRNARRLLNLVNQLLDFRRMEVQKIGLKPSYGDIVVFAEEIYTSFSDLADKKMMSYTFHSSKKEFFTYFDHDKLEKIIFNLLSNAFKFTGEHGTITVNLDFQMAAAEDDNPEIIVIKFADTGIGMTKDSTEKIFERFFQNDLPGSLVNHGSGIGLSLTKEFVMIHNGTIEVESEPGKGSCFTVKIPVIAHSSETIESTDAPFIAEHQNIILTENNSEAESIKSKPLLLLVEDNDDFRFYLKDNLKVKYSIIEASNGAEGIKSAQANLPDLIVSDIMMPEVDGLELCSNLKTDVKTSHIPIILLTARVAEQQKLAGFDTGADDFISKPFSFEILESRIQNLILQRQRIKKSFQKHFKIEPGEIGITSLDEKLINKALALVENNMGSPEFSVEKLSKELGMSRVHLYKKLLALTGKTPIEFIRTMRLKRAAQLLGKSQLNVSEIAYEVGFNDPRYFSKYFKTEFGVLPSQYTHNNQDKKPDES